MTKEFDARNENKSRSVCAAMAEAADTGKRTLTERELCVILGKTIREIGDEFGIVSGGEES